MKFTFRLSLAQGAGHSLFAALGLLIGSTGFAAALLPNLKSLHERKVPAQTPISFVLSLTSTDELNRRAPLWLTLFLQTDQGLEKIKEYRGKDLKGSTFLLPALASFKKYRLQGTFYYCRVEKTSICGMRSIDLPLQALEATQTSVQVESVLLVPIP